MPVMEGETLVSIATALLCVLAVGTGAASLDATITANPGDGVELAYDWLPVSGAHADAVVEGATAVADEAGVVVERITVTARAEGVVDELDAVAEELALDEDARPAFDRPSSAAEWDRAERPSDPPEVVERDESNEQSEGWIGRIATLLREARVLLVAFGLLASVLVYRHVDDLRALIPEAPFAEYDENDPAGTEDAWPAAEPPDEVSRAWTEMVRRLEAEEPRSKTTAECATLAVEAGMEPAAVRTITRAFEAVRYGDGEVTDERVRRVRGALRELDPECELERESEFDYERGLERKSERDREPERERDREPERERGLDRQRGGESA